MKKSLLVLFLFVSIASMGQSAKDLEGSWKFSTLAEKSGVKASEKEMFLMILKDLSFSFNADKTYAKSMLGEETTGTFEVKPGKLILTGESGNLTTHKLILVEKERMTLKHGDVTIVLVRS